MQAHGNATAYAFMLDADFVVKEPWRLRITAQRMVAECGERSVEECGKGMKVLVFDLDKPWTSRYAGHASMHNPLSPDTAKLAHQLLLVAAWKCYAYGCDGCFYDRAARGNPAVQCSQVY